jgi:hypothetical protein
MVTKLRIKTNETVKMDNLPHITTQLYTALLKVAYLHDDNTYD